MSLILMEECFRCGVTKEETRLLDAISEEGIVKACRDCVEREDLPTIKKPSLDQLKESDERLSVREKLSMMAGIESRRDSKGNREYVKTSSEKKKDEYDLNDIIERNLERKKISKDSLKKLPPEKKLVENFHWKVMRGRRLKKMSKKQLGVDIGESETAINMVERGELPEDFERLIKKLEAYLRIRLFKNHERSLKDKKSEAEVKFDLYSTKNTKVGDLKQGEEGLGESENGSKENEENLDDGDYDYPEQNKTRKSRLWNLFRKKARDAQKREEDISERDANDLEEGANEGNEKDNKYENTLKENSEGLYYGDLEDYNYQEYEEPEKNKKKEEERKRKSKEKNTNNKDKRDNEKSSNRDEDISRRDIDDLIFRKS